MNLSLYPWLHLLPAWLFVPNRRDSCPTHSSPEICKSVPLPLVKLLHHLMRWKVFERERESQETSTFINALFYIWNYDGYRKAGDKVFCTWMQYLDDGGYSQPTKTRVGFFRLKKLCVNNIRFAMGIHFTVANELKMYGGCMYLDT